jgi:hypothetical protein
LLANGRKISYTVRLGFFGMGRTEENDERGTDEQETRSRKQGNVSENKRDLSIMSSRHRPIKDLEDPDGRAHGTSMLSIG